MTCLLYKREEAWGLPSLSSACIQAEALLRFSGADFRVIIQREPGRSPTGFHPAFEKEQKLASTDNCITEFDCARRIHAFLKSTSADVDAHLSQEEAAMSKAMTTLIEQDLEPATLFTTWCEKEGFKQYKDAFGGRLLFPLNFIVAKAEQRRMRGPLAKMRHEDAACDALDAISHFLGSQNQYLFGDVPCSTDAYLYGHLLFYRLSPVTSPVLQRKLNELDNVKAYVQRITTNYFAEGVPALESFDVTAETEDEEMSSAWSTSHASATLWSAQKLWDEFQKMDRMSKWWLGSATTLLLLYSWFRPPFVVVMEQDGSFVDDDEDSD